MRVKTLGVPDHIAKYLERRGIRLGDVVRTLLAEWYLKQQLIEKEKETPEIKLEMPVTKQRSQFVCCYCGKEIPRGQVVQTKKGYMHIECAQKMSEDVELSSLTEKI